MVVGFKRNPEMRSDLIMMTENLVQTRRQALQMGGFGGTALTWQPPPIALTKKTSNNLHVQRPHRDLILTKIFKTWFHGQEPSDFGLPLATIYEDGVPIAQGLLVRAAEWNPPEGCLRVISDAVYSFEKSQEISNSSQDLSKDQTEILWKATVTDFGQAMRCSEKALKDITEEVQNIYVDGIDDTSKGVFTSIAAVKTFVQKKMDEAKGATDGQGGKEIAPAQILGAQEAAQDADFSCLLSSSDAQMGAFYGAAAATKRRSSGSAAALAASVAKRPNLGGLLTPQGLIASRTPQCHAVPQTPQAQLGGAGAGVGVFTGPVPTTPQAPVPTTPQVPAPQPVPPVVAQVQVAFNNPGDFCTTLTQEMAGLPARGCAVFNNALAIVKKIASTDLSSVKPNQVSTTKTKVSEAIVKNAPHLRSKDIYNNLVEVLQALVDFGDNQSCGGSTGGKKKGQQLTGVKTDPDKLFVAMLKWESFSVEIGWYAYRTTFECKYDVLVESACWCEVSKCLDMTKPSPKGQPFNFFTLGDLVCRGAPQHEVLDLQLSSIDEKVCDCLRKDKDDTVLDNLVRAFLGVAQLPPSLLDQLDMLLKLVNANTTDGSELTAILGKIRSASSEGLMHHIKHQKGGIRLRRQAATKAGTNVSAHLSVRKAEQLKSALELQAVHTFASYETFAAIYKLWQEVDQQAQSNATYRESNGAIIKAYKRAVLEIIEDFKEQVTKLMHPHVQALHPAESPAVYAGLEDATSTRASMHACGEHMVTNLKTMVGAADAKGGEEIITSFEYYAQSQIDLNDIVVEVNGKNVAKLSDSLNRAGRCKISMDDVDLDDKAQKFITLATKELKTGTDIVLKGAGTKLNSLFNTIFSGKFTSLSQCKEINTDKMTLPMDQKDLCLNTLESSAKEIRAIANGIQSNQVQVLLDVFGGSDISASFPGALLLLPHVVEACFHAKGFTSAPKVQFDSACIQDLSKAQREITNFCDNVSKQMEFVSGMKTTIDAMTQTMANDNAYKVLERKIDAKPRSSSITTASYECVAGFFAPMSAWHANTFEAIASSIASLAEDLIKKLKATSDAMEAFTTTNPDGAGITVEIVQRFYKENEHIKNGIVLVLVLSILTNHLQKKLSDHKFLSDRPVLVMQSALQ